MFARFSAVKGFLLFWLCFLSLLGVFGLAYFKNVSVDLLIPAILGIYATHSFGKQASAHYNSRLDDTADTAKVIESTKES